MRNPIHSPEGKNFHKVFGISVLKFWHPFFGFDVIEFDKWVGTPDGMSCNDHVEKKYGKGASDIIGALLHTESGMTSLAKKE
jgi:hypothetical protein